MFLEILKRFELSQVPSASGVEVFKDFYYLVGDNSPWLFKLDDQYTVLEKILIAKEQTAEIIEKKLKPDFEAMTLVKYQKTDEILIFGSGSKAELRDGLVRVRILNNKHEVLHYSLTKLYSKIRKKSDLDEDTFNIEAAACDGKRLILLNRGKNRVIVFKLKDFMKYVDGEGPCPDPKLYKIRLPKLGNIRAGLSGAAITPDNKKMIFTASVENTTNTIDDGQILGSFVGVLSLKKLGKRKKPETLLINKNDEAILFKVESVATVNMHPEKGIFLRMVTDSDGKESEMVEALLKLKP